MASPFSMYSQCQTFGVFALFPDRSQVCRFSRIRDAFSGTLLNANSAIGMTVHPRSLVHLCGIDEWSAARGHGGIHPDASGADGQFIHLSTPDHVHLPANRLFRGRDDLVLLHGDPALLDAPVRWEPGVATDPESMLFPHLYGALPVRAVIRVSAYPPDPDGSFPPLAGSQDAT